MINAVNEFLDDLRGGRMTEAPVVTVEQGQLQGRVATSPTGKNFYSFQGIPYAKPPLGSLRFQAPQPAEPWEGIRDATSEGNVSAQFDFTVKKEYTGDENCLFLNVYTPNLDGEFLPVMVYIHGGGFKFGSGNSELYGPDYLVEKDVVVVTINYRCGVLGFLCLNTPEVPGNAGLKDMVEALRWVKTNIHNFGGNSGNITIFGESAGGYAVNCLMVSPLSKNLINKAIIQSGTGLCPWGSQKKPLDNAKSIAKSLGCEGEDPEEILEFLRACSAKEIVETHTKILLEKTFPKYFEDFCVVIEKEFPGVEGFLTESFVDFLTSGRVANVPIMIGTCTLEFGFDKLYDDLQAYIPDELNIERDSPEALEIVEKIKRLYFNGNPIEDKSEAYYQLMSDRVVKVDTHRVIQYLVQVTNKPIYYYNFDYVGSLNMYGKLMGMGAELKKAAHLDELGYLFRNMYQDDVEPSAQDIKTRERMLRLWTNFAKGGNPTPDENHYLTVAWPPVTKDNLTYLNISNELTLASNPDKERMDFWDDLYSKHFRIWEHPKTNTAEVLIKYDPPVVVGGTETVTIVSSEVTESSEGVIETTEVITVSNNGDGSEPVVVSELIVVGSEPVIEGNEQVAAVSEPITEEPVPDEPNEIEPTPLNIVDGPTAVTVVDDPIVEPLKIKESDEPISIINNHVNGDRKARPSNEIKMVSNANGAPKDVIRANDPPEDDLPKNIGVNKFVNFFESLGGKK